MSDTITTPLVSAEPTAYQAALTGAALYDSSARGRLLMRDRDRAALLHRLATNDIAGLQPGQGLRAVLATPIGRMIDLLTVYSLADALLLISSPGRGPATMAYLRKNIFFNDKVKLEDVGTSLGQLSLYGPRAAALLGDLGLPGTDLPLHGIAAGTWNEATLHVAPTMPIGGAGYTIILPAEQLPALSEALQSAGAHSLDVRSYDVLRSEQGYPSFGRELSPDYIPLEAGLWDAISFKKGCYVGQEIIARMESRGRIAKLLRGLRFPDGPPAGELPLKLSADGREVGDLTSLVASPRFGTIGLAYVRSAHAEPGTAVTVAGLPAQVVDVPFVKT